jgi:hypothetical protein
MAKSSSSSEATKNDNKDTEIVLLEDDEDKTEKPKDDSAAAKKPTLKLASFADMGSNGITDSSSQQDDAKSGECSQCKKDILGFKSATVWETMQFCDDTCLGKCDFLRNCGKNKTENHFSHYPRSQVDINSYTRLKIAMS